MESGKTNSAVDSGQEALKLNEVMGYTLTNRQGFDQNESDGGHRCQPEDTGKWWCRGFETEDVGRVQKTTQ